MHEGLVKVTVNDGGKTMLYAITELVIAMKLLRYHLSPCGLVEGR